MVVFIVHPVRLHVPSILIIQPPSLFYQQVQLYPYYVGRNPSWYRAHSSKGALTDGLYHHSPTQIMQTAFSLVCFILIEISTYLPNF